MATQQSAWAKGNRQTVRPQTAGAVHTQLFSFTCSANVETTDIIELGELMPFARVCDAIVFTEGTFTGITADIGLMSGNFGDKDSVRTSGNELFAAADLAAAGTAIVRLSKKDMLSLATTEASRGIGVKVSAQVAGAATKKIHLLLSYYQTGETT
ncbi:hypothetical protein D3C76_47990 [compost metagenome]